jgi:hypothetical protein
MPRYDYTCTKCQVTEEVDKSYKDYDREEFHSCGSKMDRGFNLKPFFDGALTPSRGGASLQAIKKDDKELSSYYSAVKQGIEPISTKQKDIDAAVNISNDLGKAFDGNNIGASLLD